MGLWTFSCSSLLLPDGENSYIAGLVHVREEPGDGHVADCLLEEHLLDGGRAHRAERWQEQEELAEATGLSRVPGRHERGSNTASPLSPSPGLPHTDPLTHPIHLARICLK